MRSRLAMGKAKIHMDDLIPILAQFHRDIVLPDMQRLMRGFLLGGFLLTCGPALAQNQAVNPGFVSDLSGWTMYANPGFTSSHDATQGYSTPGALRVSATFSISNLLVARQCLPVTAGQVLDYGGKFRFESGHEIDVKGYATVRWSPDAACATMGLFGPLFQVVDNLPDVWQPIRGDSVTVPAGTNSAYFLLGIDMSPGEGVGWFDDVFFGPAPLPVELLSLEIE